MKAETDGMDDFYFVTATHRRSESTSSFGPIRWREVEKFLDALELAGYDVNEYSAQPLNDPNLMGTGRELTHNP